MSEAAPQHSLLAQIFISPDEPRLRAGWRLLIHLILFIVALIVLSLIWGTALMLLAHIKPDEIATIASTSNDLLIRLSYIPISIAAYTLSTRLARRFLDRRSFVSLGFHYNNRTILDLLFGIALGGVLMGLIYAAESAAGWLHFENWAWQQESGGAVAVAVISAFLFYVGVGYQEELFSRGYHLQNLWAGLNLPLALLISSGVFALLHLGNPGADWVSTLGIFFAGLFLALGYLRTGELWIPIGLHIGWNFFQGTIFGFPVSGTEGYHLIRQTVEGPKLITGGIFGPEAGLVSWAAMLVGAALIWLYTQNRTRALPTTKSNVQSISQSTEAVAAET